jgi:hypothetical protein
LGVAVIIRPTQQYDRPAGSLLILIKLTRWVETTKTVRSPPQALVEVEAEEATVPRTATVRTGDFHTLITYSVDSAKVEYQIRH